ncbi:unnamed protein product [Ascophyllum nodosum]
MFRPWSGAEDRLLALTPLGDVPSGKHADEPRAPMSIRSIRQYRTTGLGTSSGKSNYTGEVRKMFSNSVIETGVLRVAGWRRVMWGILGSITQRIAPRPANVGSRDGTVGHYSRQLLKIRDAYSVAAWTGLYGHMYTGDYASAHGRYGSCKCLTSTAYKINCSRFTRDHSCVRGRYVRDTRKLFVCRQGKVGSCMLGLRYMTTI